MYESQQDKATALIEKFRLDHVERIDLVHIWKRAISPRTNSNDGCFATAKILSALLLIRITTWDPGIIHSRPTSSKTIGNGDLTQ